MFLTDLSIKRPVVASVMSLILVIFGLVTFQEIPTDELPDVQPPVCLLYTSPSPRDGLLSRMPSSA